MEAGSRHAARLAVFAHHLLGSDPVELRNALRPRSTASQQSGQVIVITGCTSGLGLNLAHEYIRLGHTVVGCGRRAAIIEQLNKEYASTASSFHVVDAASEPQLASLAKEVEQRHGRVDVLIANAGLGGGGKVPWELPVEQLNSIVDVSLKGLMFTNKHFIPLMLKDLEKVPLDSPRRVINISSGVAHTSIPFLADYCAVKFGVEGWSKCVAQTFKMAPPEWKDRIICVPFSPGVVQTEMNRTPNFPTAATWCKDAAPFILQIPATENGSSIVMPGYYSQEYQATWIVPANARMNDTWAVPKP